MKTIIQVTIFGIIFWGVQGCAMSFQEQYPKAYEKYSQLELNKAFAFAKGKNGRAVWGYGYGYDSIERAKEQALFQCKGRRIPYKIEEECEIYFINDKNLVDPKEEKN